MGIYLDSREPAKFKRLFDAHGLKYEIRQLVTGDVVMWNDAEPESQVVIERKRLDDLISSYYSKRMGEQFERLSEEKFAVLIITGNLDEVLRKMPKNISARVMPQIIEEVISMAVIQYNFRSVIWLMDGVQDVHESGFLMMVKCIQKVVNGNLDSIPQKKIKLSKDLRVNTIRQMFGLDTGAAKNLLRKYGTVRAVLKLTDSDFLNVKGIGPAKVKTIRYILDESFNRGNYETKKDDQNKKCTKCGNKMTIVKMPGGNTYMCTFCIGSLH